MDLVDLADRVASQHADFREAIDAKADAQERVAVALRLLVWSCRAVLGDAEGQGPLRIGSFPFGVDWNPLGEVASWWVDLQTGNQVTDVQIVRCGLTRLADDLRAVLMAHADGHKWSRIQEIRTEAERVAAVATLLEAAGVKR